MHWDEVQCIRTITLPKVFFELLTIVEFTLQWYGFKCWFFCLNYEWDKWLFGKLRLVLFKNYFYFSIYGIRIWNEVRQTKPPYLKWPGICRSKVVFFVFFILYAINWANIFYLRKLLSTIRSHLYTSGCILHLVALNSYCNWKWHFELKW